MNLFIWEVLAAKEVHANASGETFEQLQGHRVELPVVETIQEIGKACEVIVEEIEIVIFFL